MNPALLDALNKGPLEFRYPIAIVWVHRLAAVLGALLLLLFWYAFLVDAMGLTRGLKIAEFLALVTGTVGLIWYYSLFLPRTKQVLSVSREGITLAAGPGSPTTLLWKDIGTVKHRLFAYTLDLVSRDGAQTIRVGGDVGGFQALKDIAISLSNNTLERDARRSGARPSP
jgi:hypothetical protein